VAELAVIARLRQRLIVPRALRNDAQQLAGVIFRARHIDDRGIGRGFGDDLLNYHSGLLGISGVSSDMREIVKAKESGNPRAKLAFDIFVHRLRSGIGSMVAVLGGLDALIFTAGIGENSEAVRQAACAGFGYLGLALKPGKNNRSPVDQDIAASDSAVRVLVIHAQEDWAIARECWKMASKS
jgi:acetate kinase